MPPATRAADPDTESTSADHPDPTADTGDSGIGQINDRVATRPVIDDTEVIDDADVVNDSVPDPVVEADELTQWGPESVPTDEVLAAETAQVASPGRTRLIVAAALLLLTVVCGVLSFWFFYEANELRNEGPAANQALTNPAATSEVNSQIKNAVQQVFSYDFTNTGKTENAARNLLVGPAVQQYNELYAVVKQLVPQQKLVLTTTVQASAVTMLQGDRAQLLLIVNQNDTRTDTGQSNSDTAQLSVGVVKQGTQWKIEQITQL